MEQASVIVALRAKRAQLAADLRQIEERAAQLRGDMLTIDGAIRVFDPGSVPEAPRRARVTGPHGRFSRAVLDTLRRADAPMTCRQVAELVAAECGIEARTSQAMTVLTHRVRTTLARKRVGLASERRGDTIFWRAA